MKKLLILFLIFCSGIAFANDAEHQKGWDAHNAGRFDEALAIFQPLAEQGSAAAQSTLGYMYTHGEGVVQDYKEALKWVRKSAKQGNGWGQFNLGNMYKNGWGTDKNCRKAKKWYKKSAKQGNESAQKALADVGC